MKYASWGLLLSFSLLTSCAMLGLGQQGGLNLQAQEKERLHRELTGKEYVLASSVYSSTFFGNDSRLLVDARKGIVEGNRYSQLGIGSSRGVGQSARITDNRILQPNDGCP